MRRFFNRQSNRPKSSRRNASRRQLRTEMLETRRLLAVDCFHNSFEPEDVNDDGFVSAVDALAVINAMNRGADGEGEMFTDVNNDGRRTAIDALRVINRLNRGRGPDQPAPAIEESIPDVAGEPRSIDGTGNNLESPELGSAGQQLLRVAEADYADGISQPSGADRPSPREISNLLSAAGEEGIASERDLTAFLYVWGQFLDHDITLSPHQEGDDAESFDIEVPAGDQWFDPEGTGEVVLPFTRSDFDPTTGTSVENPRQQYNAITTWIDGSQVYGSDQETADLLREFVGGRMRISDEGLAPTDDDGNVLAGDIRAAENPALLSMHALFLREHNRLADAIAAENPELGDEEIYQQARSIVIAEMQAITYNEFLPALLGRRAISRYQGYDATVDPSIATEFSTAAFRFGHSTANNDIEFFDNDGRAVREELALAEAFFNPSLLEETGIDSVLKYDASSLSQEIDLTVIDDLRSFLFGAPGAGGLDLVALNIQRGRDHGLADYNATRVAYGLDAYESFAQLTSDAELQDKLESLYGDIDNIDLWIGILAEDHLRGASVGELTSTIIADQFERIRDGDRFWYENVFSGSDLRNLRQTSLSDVVQRNTNVTGLQENVFFFRSEIRGTVWAAGTGEDTAPNDLLQDRSRREQRRDRDSRGVADVAVELLDDEGNVVDTAVTDRRGNYRFRSFEETGDYQVRIAENDSMEVVGENLIDILISTGDMRIRDMNFEVIV